MDSPAETGLFLAAPADCYLGIVTGKNAPPKSVRSTLGAGVYVGSFEQSVFRP